MIIKILALADILTIISLLGVSLLPQKLVLAMAIYLMLKGLVFILIGSLFPNFIDMLCGFYIIFAAFGITHWIPTVIVILFIGQKAFFSLV
ncbi:hypothetical protein J4230_01805 [Candidatus Woesearchaeota archaeon]|nr:hypothetical protein [Candidatus Woesearchaeota archaeon]